MKKKFLLFIISLTMIFSSFMVVCNAKNLEDAGEVLNTGASGAGYNLSFNSPLDLIGTIIKAFLSFLGVLFLILMVYGGFLWMTARGNEAQVTKSKDLMTAAVIGLIIILLSYAISNFVIANLSKETLDIK